MKTGNRLAVAAPRSRVAAALCAGSILWAAAAYPAVHPLSAGPASSDVADSPDERAPKIDTFGRWVVYLDDAETVGLEELWSASLHGGDPIRLSGAMLPDDEVSSFAISPDGSFVAFLASYSSFYDELYIVPIEGGTPVRRNHDLALGEFVDSFEISPDAQWLLYVVGEDDERALFRIAVSGGSEVQYTYTNATICIQFVDSFEISPDSAIVAFRTSLSCQDVGSPFRYLYRVPLVGTAATQVAATVDNGFVGSYGFTQPIVAEDPVLVFLIDFDGGGPVELRWSKGGSFAADQVISGTFVPGGNATSFATVPGGQKVVFRADRELDQVFRLYLTTAGIEGPVQVPARLHEEIFPTPGVRELYTVAPGGDRVAYVIDDNPVGGVPFEQLRSAAVASPGSSVLLSEPSVEDAFFQRVEISAGTGRAIFLVNRDELFRAELFSAPVAGGATVRLNPFTSSEFVSWKVLDFAISPDGSRVHFVHDSETSFPSITHVAQLRSSPIAGGGSTLLGPNIDRLVSGGFYGLWAPLRSDWAVSINDSQDPGAQRLTLSDGCLFCDAFEGSGDGLARWSDTVP